MLESSQPPHDPTPHDPEALDADATAPEVGALFPDRAGGETTYYTAALPTEHVLHEGGSALNLHPALNGKDEMNLAEFPIARLGRNDTRLTIEYKGRITDKLGNVIEQRWLVSGNATFGLPTEFADRVLVALMYITSQENLKDKRPDRRVPFTTYRILKLLGLSLNQRNYAAVEKALQQLVGVTIYSEGAFWDHEHQRRVTTKKGFHILEEFWLKSFDEENPESTVEGERGAEGEGHFEDGAKQSGAKKPITGYIIWGERIWDSFQAGYIKNLDVEFYYALENTLARRLYRFLDKRMHYQNSYQIDIFDLAARMGMKPYPYASHLARKLKPAFDELLEQGYLATAEVIKVGDFTRVRFVRAQGQDGDASTRHALADYQDDTAEYINGTRYVTTPSQNAVEARRDAISPARVQTYTRDAIEASEADFEVDAECEKLWASVLSEYQRTLPSATYAMLATSQLVQLEDRVAIITVEPRYQEWIERQMVRQIKALLNQYLEPEARVSEVKVITR